MEWVEGDHTQLAPQQRSYLTRIKTMATTQDSSKQHIDWGQTIFGLSGDEGTPASVDYGKQQHTDWFGLAYPPSN